MLLLSLSSGSQLFSLTPTDFVFRFFYDHSVIICVTDIFVLYSTVSFFL